MPHGPCVHLVEDQSLRPSSWRRRPFRVVRRARGFEAQVGGGRLQLGPGTTVAVRIPPGLSREALRNTALPLLRAAVFRAFAEQGFSVLHAAAFEVAERGFLVVGESGTGKSTLAMLALRAGGRVVSDDSVLMGPIVGGRPGVAAFRKDAVLRDAGERIIPPVLRGRLHRALVDGIERPVLARARAPEAFASTVVPQRLFISRVDRRLRGSRCRRTTQADALAALIAASSPLFLAPELGGLRARLLPVLAATVGACAAYRVALGRDVLADPDAVASHLFSRSPLAAVGRGNAA